MSDCWDKECLSDIVDPWLGQEFSALSASLEKVEPGRVTRAALWIIDGRLTWWKTYTLYNGRRQAGKILYACLIKNNKLFEIATIDPFVVKIIRLWKSEYRLLGLW